MRNLGGALLWAVVCVWHAGAAAAGSAHPSEEADSAVEWSSVGPSVAADHLADLSIEELSEVVVSSVSRRDQPLLDAAASVYIITGDDLRRTGVTTLPEALRLAPNLEVAAVDARQYAVSARGFNSNISNKLLVLVDGRAIYSPLFSGVFWDAQDFVPADIDRIEVISGPAGATWGTNAVNGVINVVTRSSAQTRGPLLSTTLGDREKTAWARYGGSLGDGPGGATFSAHLKTYDRASTFSRADVDLHDAAHGGAGGVRVDWTGARDALMIDAAAYTGRTDARPVSGVAEISGAHLLGKWSRRLDASADFDLQAYYDRTERIDPLLIQDRDEIFDAEGKYRTTHGAHRWLLGLGLRQSNDDAQPGQLLAFLPPRLRQRWYSAFAQDEIALARRVTLTLGGRVERNPYTGWEMLPSARLGYALRDDAFVWTALSRAVRSPARLDRELFAPPAPPFAIAGGPEFRSEIAQVLEVGYRAQVGAAASWSATAFLQDYQRLRSVQLFGPTIMVENRIAGQTAGLEAWGQWRPRADWRLDAGLLYLDKNLHLTAGSNDPVGPDNLGDDPRSQLSLRLTHDFGDRLDMTMALRRVGSLPAPAVPAYVAADFQLNWHAQADWQVGLGIRNAVPARHVEYSNGVAPNDVPRSAFVSVTYQPR